MAGDKDLNDDLIKRVRYWAVYTEQGLEATFPDSFCTITGRKDESRFISWKTSEFYNKVRSSNLDLPVEWNAREPVGVILSPNREKIINIINPANEFLLIDFEVVSRYQKEDLKMDVRQAKFYETGTVFFDANKGGPIGGPPTPSRGGAPWPPSGGPPTPPSGGPPTPPSGGPPPPVPGSPPVGAGPTAPTAGVGRCQVE